MVIFIVHDNYDDIDDDEEENAAVVDDDDDDNDDDEANVSRFSTDASFPRNSATAAIRSGLKLPSLFIFKTVLHFNL